MTIAQVMANQYSQVATDQLAQAQHLPPAESTMVQVESP